MNCELCKQESEAYREGKLPEGIRDQIKSHLESCNDCAKIFDLMNIADNVIKEEKKLQSNPFLVTRIMAGIEALESSRANGERIPAYRKVLKPVLISVSVAVAIFMGIITGNLYQPTTEYGKIPVEMTYMNDAALESIDLLSNN